ncbi:MAG: ParA family protein [Deltaproteobacteria bacterium]|nr:ParA family protein [Deltaproteobacteria bacterium]
MIIAIINNKGGTGKTTTSVNLSAAFADSGYRVLLVDLDSQASASLSLGIKYSDLAPSMADVLFDDILIKSAVRPSARQRLELVTGGTELANSDLILADVPGRENRLAECLKGIRQEYDFIICDCPPSLSLLSINAMVAADRYIVPLTAEYLALEGLISLMAAVEKLKTGMGIDTELLGILFTMVGTGLKSAREIVDLVLEHYGEDVFKTRIRRNVSLGEAPSFGMNIFDYAPKAHGAEDYLMLADEVVERCGIK